MIRAKWLRAGIALALMTAAALWLNQLGNRVKLGPPGVNVVPTNLYAPDGTLISNRTIFLPTNVPDYNSQEVAIGEDERSGLPIDTTIGRRYYFSTNLGMEIQGTVVLMGTDHTSIHQPQYCLFAQDWIITKQERISLHIERPHPYDLPAVKLTASQTQSNGVTLNAFYVYWFVSGNKITAEEGSRLWSQWKAVIQEGVTERWAYISYFTPCAHGSESDTFEKLQKFIAATVPEFQTVTLPASPVATGKTN